MDARSDGIETKKTYCRYCHGCCAMEVDVKDGKPIAVRGDVDDPIYGGYSCIKGQQLVDLYHHPDRLRQPLKRMPDGSFKPISSQQAMDEIAERVRTILDQHGGRAIASYCGTYAFMESAALAVSRGFHQGIRSDSYYTSVTLDQPGKMIAASRFGFWGGGIHSFDSADVIMSVGNNPQVSVYSPFGQVPPFSPTQKLNDAKARGLKVICIDPRVTDLARKADLYLQPRPGQDPTLLAGIIKVILDEDLYDHAFVDTYTDGVEALKASLKGYTLDYVSRRTDVPAAQITAAARMFAAGPRGCAGAGTGPDMAPRGNLTEHLILTLNTLCGRMNREGDTVPNPGVLAPAVPRKAEVVDMGRAWGTGPRSRVRGLGQIFGEMPSATIADEILLPGDGQIKALFSVGGNPLVAWPDQIKAKKAMDALDLLVCIDIKMAATAKHADYIIAGKICLQREDTLVLTDTWYSPPYGNYAEAVCDDDGDLMEEWEFYWELAKRLGTDIPLLGGNAPMDEKPVKFDVLSLITAGSRVPLANIRASGKGAVYDLGVTVEPGDAEAAKLMLAPADVAEELTEIRSEVLNENGIPAGDADYSHLLVSRRLKHVYNSSGQELPRSRKKGTTNPAYMHPDDIAALGIASGDIVQISGKHGEILGVAEAAPDVKPGVISMAHAWGDLPGNEGNVRDIGSSTNRLLADDKEFDPITGMARQSAIPVNVRPSGLG